MMDRSLRDARVGIAMTGSFCTFQRVFSALPELLEAGAALYPILSFHAATEDTRFGSAEQMIRQLTEICGRPPMTALHEVETIGPGQSLDLLIVLPCTGNTCAKLAAGIADTPVTFAVKSHLRNERPVLIGISTNDGLGVNARAIGELLSRNHLFFVPFGQDDPEKKPRSLVFDPSKLRDSAVFALNNRQIQPIVCGFEAKNAKKPVF